MHRPVLQQREDRRTHVTAARPPPAATAASPAAERTASERAASERRAELPECGAAPLEVAPLVLTGTEGTAPLTVPATVSVFMSM
ncbi:hypothetical protein [Streptomyces sp. NPDC002666]